MTKDPTFRPKEFLNGARMAYEMIVMGFADGDRKTLKNLLSKEVFDGFEAAIAERESRGEVVKSTFVGIEKADITQASVRDSEVQITLRIVSQLISATYDKMASWWMVIRMRWRRSTTSGPSRATYVHAIRTGS